VKRTIEGSQCCIARRFLFQEKLAAETEGVFNSALFEKLSGVCTAVDDAASRLYIDARCVAFGKPMLDGGKLGTKGSVQVKYSGKIRCLVSVVSEAGFCSILVIGAASCANLFLEQRHMFV
jgi:molybdopterin/thiamine biosynthesis adenylyltransferase